MIVSYVYMCTCCINLLVDNQLYLYHSADLKRAQDAGDVQSRSLAAIKETYAHIHPSIEKSHLYNAHVSWALFHACTHTHTHTHTHMHTHTHTRTCTHTHTHSVSTSKHTLLFQAEESARLEKENRELEFKLGQLQETHKCEV